MPICFLILCITKSGCAAFVEVFMTEIVLLENAPSTLVKRSLGHGTHITKNCRQPFSNSVTMFTVIKDRTDVIAIQSHKTSNTL